jgi:uncharacterized membrane protein (UPF0127 family)
VRTPLRLIPALLALLVTAQTPAPPNPDAPYCVRVPLPALCWPLPIKTPRALMRLAVVTNDALRERGLMFVREVPHGEGMLFVFPGGDQPLNFWMKDTITPLDMVFVDQTGQVTSIAADVPATTPSTPEDQIPRRHGTGAYVIELGAGDAARLGLVPGVHLRIPPIPAQ